MSGQGSNKFEFQEPNFYILLLMNKKKVAFLFVLHTFMNIRFQHYHYLTDNP